MTGEGIWFCNHEGREKSIQKELSDAEYCGLSVIGNSIYCSLQENPAYTRIEIDAAESENDKEDSESFTAEESSGREGDEISPLVELDLEKAVKQAESDQWLYTVYPAFVEINGYTGDEEIVTLPEELDGLPVRRINCDDSQSSSLNVTDVRTLILPESLYTIKKILISGLESIELPESSAYCFR